jgi:hypothetical protein
MIAIVLEKGSIATPNRYVDMRTDIKVSWGGGACKT